MVVAELVSHIRSELGIRKPLPRLPYSLVLMGGYAFDVFARLTGKRFPISSIRIKSSAQTPRFPPSLSNPSASSRLFPLKEGLSLMMGSMIKKAHSWRLIVRSPPTCDFKQTKQTKHVKPFCP